MTQKFVMGSPLYRQEQEFKYAGIELSRQTMSNWILKEASENWLAPVFETMHTELLKHDILHADETTLQVLHEPGKSAQSKSYMWLYRTGREAVHPIVLYEYHPNRKADNPISFLKGFRGCLHTDGYQAYGKLENVTLVGCWAHARRKFDEAVKALPKSQQKTSSASSISVTLERAGELQSRKFLRKLNFRGCCKTPLKKSRANRYTFVWRKTTEKHLAEVKDTVRREFARHGIPGHVTLKKLRALVSSEKASCEEAGIQFVHGAGHHKPPEQRAYEKLSALLEKWEGYEKKLFTMGNYRNSYSKTDPDATFMHMKEDHMRMRQLCGLSVSFSLLQSKKRQTERTAY